MRRPLVLPHQDIYILKMQCVYVSSLSLKGVVGKILPDFWFAVTEQLHFISHMLIRLFKIMSLRKKSKLIVVYIDFADHCRKPQHIGTLFFVLS